jgi:YfiH family protein
MSQLASHTFGGIRSRAFSNFGLQHHFFERVGGESQPPYQSFNCAYKTVDPHAPQNREALFTALGLKGAATRILNPCHGDKIAIVTEADWSAHPHDVLIGTDAALTRTPGTYFVMSTADCLPVLLTDTHCQFAGIVHLGWRNIVAGFMNKVLDTVQQQLGIDPTTLRAAIGPSIYPCCYVYENPIQKEDLFWQPYLKRLDSDRYAIDLVSPVKAQLLSAGIAPDNLFEAGICTGCHNDQFFSCYLEGHTSGRFPTVVGLVQA